MQTDIWKRLKRCQKPILLYGMGNGADSIIKRLKKENIEVSGVFASDDFVRGQTFRGMQVLNYKTAKEVFKNFIVLVAFGTSDSEIIERITQIASEQELYIPDVPVFGNTVFDSDYYTDNVNEINYVRSKLADERSKEVFDAIIDYKLLGKIESLIISEDDELTTIKELINLKDNATIFDLGAYTGDTAQKFLKLFPATKKIVAVEPDSRNFSRLKNSCLPKTECVNAAISYLDGVMHFSDEGGRNQSVNCGKNMVATVTIDTLTERFSAPDFIKFDIEGQELNALIGGEKAIKEYKPILMVSAYHRSEDIVALPKKILSLRDDYKMYIRHFPYIPCWDTYYIFI